MSDIVSLKNQLRLQLRQSRRQYHQSNPVVDYSHIFDFLKTLKPAGVIGSYQAVGDEFPMLAIHDFCFDLKMRLALPVLHDDGSMVFQSYDQGTVLVSNKFNIQEPVQDEAAVMVPDVLLVPGLGFDIKGNRLGQGKGHYDRYLEKEGQSKNIVLIGMGYDCQIVNEIPTESHDQVMDFVFTDQRIIEVK